MGELHINARRELSSLITLSGRIRDSVVGLFEITLSRKHVPRKPDQILKNKRLLQEMGCSIPIESVLIIFDTRFHKWYAGVDRIYQGDEYALAQGVLTHLSRYRPANHLLKTSEEILKGYLIEPHKLEKFLGKVLQYESQIWKGQSRNFCSEELVIIDPYVNRYCKEECRDLQRAISVANVISNVTFYNESGKSLGEADHLAIGNKYRIYELLASLEIKYGLRLIQKNIDSTLEKTIDQGIFDAIFRPR